MTDEQTAAQLVSFGQCSTDAKFEAAIVRALQAARKEGSKQVVDEAERVSQILQSANTANADSEAKARFEVDRFAFACAGSVVGSTLTDYQKHALFHQFKNMFDSHESALQAARKECMDADDVDLVAPTPEVVSTFRTKAPPGHIIDDAGVVRRVLGVLPVTADGCVAAPGGVIWPQLLIDNDEGGRVAWSLYDICTGDTCDDGEWLADKCWSTKEAAEAAKEAQ